MEQNIIERDYQVACRQAVVQGLDDYQRVLFVLPTGAGKTITMIGIIKDLIQKYNKPVAIIAHKKDLIHQLNEVFTNADFNGRPFRVAVEQAENIDLSFDTEYDVAICSIQTLQRRPHVLEDTDFGTIFIDETHRAVAAGYVEIVEKLGCYKAEGPKLVGLTATDYTGAGDDLFKLFEKTVYKEKLLNFIRQGYLVPIKAEKVGQRYKDEDGQQHAMFTYQEELFDNIKEKLNTVCKNRSSIIMAASVTQGLELEEYLLSNDISAKMIYADTPLIDRVTNINAFKKGELQVLIGYQVLIEGLDTPIASALFWLRDTSSPVVFLQGLGRITRPYITDKKEFIKFNKATNARQRHNIIAQSAKPDALFFDYTNSSATNQSYTLGLATGLSTKFDFEGRDVLDVIDEIDTIKAHNPIVNTSEFTSMSEISDIARSFSLHKKLSLPNADIPEECRSLSGYSKTGIDNWVLFFSSEGVDDKLTWKAEITRDELGEYIVYLSQPHLYKVWYYNAFSKTYAMKYAPYGRDIDTSEKMRVIINNAWTVRPKYKKVCGMSPVLLGKDADLCHAIYILENYIYNNFDQSVWHLLHKEATWRTLPPSAKQQPLLTTMRNKGVLLPEHIDRGTATDLTLLYKLNMLTPFKLVKKKARKKTESVLM